MNKKIAIVPGSFDPITYGHIDIVRRASEMYDIIYLAVMINDQKNYLFDIEQRTRIAQAAVSDIPNVQVLSSKDMLWRLAEELNAVAIVKGYRNEDDLKYEKIMADFNTAHYPKAKTILLKADPTLTSVSSTLVREKLKNNEALDCYLPTKVIVEIEKILKDKVI